MIVLLKQAGWVEVRSWIKSVIGLTGAADQALPNPSRNLDELHPQRSQQWSAGQSPHIIGFGALQRI